MHHKVFSFCINFDKFLMDAPLYPDLDLVQTILKVTLIAENVKAMAVYLDIAKFYKNNLSILDLKQGIAATVGY